MNVLYYLDRFPKLSNSFIINEIYELERRGHDVAVCSLNRPEQPLVHEEFDGLDVPIRYVDPPAYGNMGDLLSTRVLRPRVLKYSFYRTSPRNHAKNLFRAKRCIEFVDELDRDVDHVHTHFASVSSCGANYVASYYDVPFTMTTHAYDLYEEPVGPYMDHLLRSVDRIATISEYNRRYIRDRFGVETPIDVVHAGIRPEKFAPTGSVVDNRILTVSRFVEKKGLRYALEAIAVVADRIPEVEYHVVGSGPLGPELERLVGDLRIEENVVFLHNVDDRRLIAEFGEARGFILPCVIAESGDRDGIPVVLMEAMATKTPPVSTRVSGIPELIDHGRNGLLVDPRDPDATADAVMRLLRNDEEWSDFRERARETVVREFDIAKEVDKLEETFEAARASR